MNLILREKFHRLSQTQKIDYISSLSEEEAEQFNHCWEVWARDNQLEPPGNWSGWMLLAGRGFGKTRTAAEWIRAKVATGKHQRIAIVARTKSDLNDVVVDGDSGLLSIYPKSERPEFQINRSRVVFQNGAIANLYSAKVPDSLRGPQHSLGWFDEAAAYQYPDEVFDQAMFGLRLGTHPQWIMTTTPRPISLIRRLINDPTVVVSRGSSYDNKQNLAPSFIKILLGKYEGTRLGRQEILGEILDDNPNALWNRKVIDQYRVFSAPNFAYVVVGVDPAVSSKSTSNNTGIVVAALGVDSHYYIIEDATLSAPPTEWAGQVISCFSKNRANLIVGETNQGGDLVEANIRACAGSSIIPFKSVRATQGKAMRAEPISTLYERGMVHHLGSLPELEDEMCDWDPTINEKSPDRVDALVWALTYLMESGGGIPIEYRSHQRKERSVGNLITRAKRFLGY
jgi:predicted phage terminase large subunit-like protein